jgi:rhodanese-related sulfurtransferase
LAFVIAHWELFAALAAVAVLLALTYQTERLQGYAGVEPTDAVRLINAGAYVLDLRPAEHFAAGHLPQAQHLDTGGIAQWARAGKRRRERPVVLIVPPGLAAGRASAALRQAGFQQVRVLRGGLKAWAAAQLPLAR